MLADLDERRTPTAVNRVVAAVGFKARRPEIPSTVNRHVAAIIESCWASAKEAAASFHCITANTIDLISYRYFSTGKLLKEADKEIGHQKTIASLSKSADDSHFLTGSSDKFAKFTNLKYSRVEIDEVRFEWAECMLDYI
ncbi:hypothetical protein ZIOFF_064927 [Zingiber officinale]|uniref:Uncharacterized protein n=1 Tax=Zingiber officinale TaxID=94328 RepID=A0A8J5KCV7_ZINOF|nr:hypothetical protein ZIOFF_064927 [Zingiber officinale]